MATGNSKMVPVAGAGWNRGLANTLRGELDRWFSNRRWWRQILIWALSVNLIYLIVAVSTPPERIELDTTLLLFNIFMGLAGPIGVSIIMQGAVVGEKRSGTAAWVLSKPVSRPAFILSKLIANTAGIVVTLLLAQGLIAYLITLFLLKVTLPVPGFLAALGVHLANILFYLTLTLLMGVLFEQPAPVIGIPLATLFAQNILMSFYPPLAAFVPWTLAIPVSNEQFPSIAMNLMAGVHIPSYLPLYTALIAAILFMAIALWAFEKQEL
jgi:ABC-2 type transport system permease protein